MELTESQLIDLVAVLNEYVYHATTYDSHCCSGCEHGDHTLWLHDADCLLLKSLRLLQTLGHPHEFFNDKPLNSVLTDEDFRILGTLRTDVPRDMQILAEMQAKLR
jgi:hypothetical protein